MTTDLHRFATAYQQELLTARQRGSRPRTRSYGNLRRITGHVMSAIQKKSLEQLRSASAK